MNKEKTICEFLRYNDNIEEYYCVKGDNQKINRCRECVCNNCETYKKEQKKKSIK